MTQMMTTKASEVLVLNNRGEVWVLCKQRNNPGWSLGFRAAKQKACHRSVSFLHWLTRSIAEDNSWSRGFGGNANGHLSFSVRVLALGL